MRRIIFVGIVFAILLFLFDRAMRIDAQHLCSNDETAYDGC